MKRFFIQSSTVLATLAFATSIAFAFSPKLSNQDSREVRYKLDCGSTSRDTTLNANSTTTLDAGCTLSVGNKAVKLTSGMECTVRNGELSCR